MRVYRNIYGNCKSRYCSLTIREGISLFWLSVLTFRMFPHYTWGYIYVMPVRCHLMNVPSLYVRVYRRVFLYTDSQGRSLTIREGISEEKDGIRGLPWFPHYTWGYIADITTENRLLAVPSLYVRVYRRIYKSAVYYCSSLTIREGISRATGLHMQTT